MNLFVVCELVLTSILDPQTSNCNFADILPWRLVSKTCQQLVDYYCIKITSYNNFLPPVLASMHHLSHVQCAWTLSTGLKYLPASLKRLDLGPYINFKRLHYDETIIPFLHQVDNPASQQQKLVTEVEFEHLPPTLTHFELHSSMGHLSANIVHCLPPSITHLVLPSLPGATDQHIDRLPPSLTHLSCKSLKHVTDRGIKALPRSLICLKFMDGGFTDAGIAHLPRNLKHLEWHTWMDQISGTGIIDLPPTLTHLDMAHDQMITGDIFCDLPRTLTYLNMAYNRNVRDHHIINLPRGLQHLNLESDPNLTDACAIDMPCLTHLNLCHNLLFTHQGIAQLPSTLLYLILHHNNQIRKASAFPKKLMYLDIHANRWLNDCSMKKLPKQLVYLNICNVKHVTDMGLQYLPATLKTLIMARNLNISDADIQSLPRGLTHLKVSHNFNLTARCFEHLPSTLQTLIISASDHIDEVTVGNLPRTLTCLKWMKSTTLTDVCMLSLPRTLRQLSLYEVPLLSARCISYLPTTLCNLCLPAGHILLSESNLPLFPPSIYLKNTQSKSSTKYQKRRWHRYCDDQYRFYNRIHPKEEEEKLI